MDAVVGDSQLLVAVVLNGVVLVQVDHGVVGPIEGELLHVLAGGVGGDEGGVDACAFAAFHTALIGVGFA